jgi:hypothetical protein
MPKIFLEKFAFYGLDMELEPEPKLFKSRNRNRNHNFFKSRNRNHNFSKVGTGTVENSYGSTTLLSGHRGVDAALLSERACRETRGTTVNPLLCFPDPGINL